VRATVARFFQMLEDAPARMPHQMPMTPAVAPVFAERYPEAAIVFDNLHSMHDVVSDILANPSVPRARKRAEILRAARLFRDDTSYVMGSTAAWVAMSRHMGIENMGGPAVGFAPALPTPTVTYGAVMTHDDRTGAMTGFAYGGAVGGAHAGHDAAAADAHAAHGAHGVSADAHAGHGAPADTAAHDGTAALRGLLEALVADPQVRARIVADSGLLARVRTQLRALPAAERQRLEQALERVPTAPPTTPHHAPSAPAPPRRRR
jgi:hypothetical protein